LLNHCEAYARGVGVTTLYLYKLDMMEFYKSQGYRWVGWTPPIN